MNTLHIREFRLNRIDEAKKLLTTLIRFQAIELRLKTLDLGSGFLTILEKHLLVRFELRYKFASVALSLVETVRWRQVRNVVRLEGVICGMTGVLRIRMKTAAIRGRARGDVLAVLVGELIEHALAFAHLIECGPVRRLVLRYRSIAVSGRTRVAGSVWVVRDIG